MVTTPNGICAIRVSKLTATGSPVPSSATGAWCSSDVAQISATPDYEDGTVTTVKNGCGRVRFYRRRDDNLTGLTIANLNMVTTAAEQMEAFLGGTVVLIGTDPVMGWALRSAGCAQLDQNGVVIEVWMENWDCNSPNADFPYIRGIIPFAKLRYDGGDHTEGEFVTKFSGYGRANAALFDGPFNDFPDELAAITDYVYAEIYDTALPSGDECISGDYTATPAQPASA